jgi:methylenetetrahydrofolate dehydrogenase (NADP+)/methenyltetrahydrofolate cyclohydrolase
MVAKIIDGKAVAQHVRQECKQQTEALKAQGVTPGLAVIIVGDNPASKVYVANKIRACTEVGLYSTVYAFAADTPDQEVLDKILALNADPSVHGILVQLPLPKHFDVKRVLAAISVDKDVDGFHLYNVGALAQGETVFPPCTPYGVSKMLEYENIPIEGQNVVVAAGVPNLILPQMVRTGAVVIDVGINRLPDGRLVGDVDFEGVRQKASYISPVPGGVGPMTITMLVHNTIQAARRSLEGVA